MVTRARIRKDVRLISTSPPSKDIVRLIKKLDAEMQYTDNRGRRARTVYKRLKHGPKA